MRAQTSTCLKRSPVTAVVAVEVEAVSTSFLLPTTSGVLQGVVVLMLDRLGVVAANVLRGFGVPTLARRLGVGTEEDGVPKALLMMVDGVISGSKSPR